MPGIDFGMRPPDLTSALMYGGPQSGPLLAAAAAWQALAAELGSTAAAYGAVISALTTGPWLGPSSLTMAAAAAPYVAWIQATAAQAQDAAAQASEAAAVFQEAFAETVPPPEIEENRVRLATLIATNFMGVNTPAIGATEADYDRMWAQDAAMMYKYAASSAAAATLVPFVPPLPTTDPAGLAGQAAAVGEATGQAAGIQADKLANVGAGTATPAGVDAQSMLSMGPQLMSMIPQVLQGFAQPVQGLAAPLQGLGQFQSLLSPFMGGFNNPGTALGGVGMAMAAPMESVGASAGGLGAGGFGGAGAISAALGRAGSVGALSVPASWAASAPGPTAQAGSVLPTASSASAPSAASTAGLGGAGGMYGAPMAAGAAAAGGDGGRDTHRFGTPIKVVPRRGGG